VTYRVTHVLDCFANFPAGLAEALFNFTTRMVGSTFGLELIVVNGSAYSFFRFSLSLIQFSF
jgi:hypothetical protein